VSPPAQIFQCSVQRHLNQKHDPVIYKRTRRVLGHSPGHPVLVFIICEDFLPGEPLIDTYEKQNYYTRVVSVHFSQDFYLKWMLTVAVMVGNVGFPGSTLGRLKTCGSTLDRPNIIEMHVRRFDETAMYKQSVNPDLNTVGINYPA